jgi:hypothetical protein
MSRSLARFWSAELPIGNPFGGPAYGKREDPITLGTTFMTSLATAAGTAAVSSLVGGKSKKAEAPVPAVEKPTLMPDPVAQQEAMRRKASILQSQSMGRAATVLTGGEKLGG